MVWGLISAEVGANQTKCSKLEQRYVIKFLVAEKSNQSDVYGEVNFSYKGLQIG